MAATPRQERKVVTILFADLVGFTSRAESLDPEDVVGILEPYHDYLRGELERFGGTVEKFIGDAVMAVFGAPVAHEDDAERAVRAALAIRDWAVETGDLQLRVAVNTGEALVTLDARPEQGRGIVAGDVVNTAARLQTAAPVNGVLVGEATRRATSEAIDYRAAPSVDAKGKAEPVLVWEALEPRARLGIDVRHHELAPLVGRGRELDVLRDALDRARQARAPQLVTLVGVPGIGKSRLVHELLALVEQDDELIVWRQGRSLPYGEGVAYWALGEMVKAQAGIFESDGDDAAAGKLRRAVAELVEDPAEARRVEQYLRPLAGIERTDPGGDRRAGAFPAWRRFFEALAERSPTVLVFEDLHWADDGLLDFVDHLVDWAADVPLLVVATARPELLDRRPGWGGGKRDAATLSLAPLTDDETAALLGFLLERSVLAADTQRTLLVRAGGNPLYAEQFARMLAERGGGDLPLPETVQGIIAARLDGLDQDEKAMLQDAAVVGKVFWSGSLTAIGDRDRFELEDRLHGLERREFVVRARRSSVAGETEYAFRHVLVRDVAYNQIPRARRASKHGAAASWIESLARREDHAEMLAYHRVQALELARASGQPTAELESAARLALRDAGERALALSAMATANQHFEAALALWPLDDPERAALLLAYGRSRPDDSSLDDAVLDDARDGLLAAGDRQGAAEAEALHAAVWLIRGDRAETDRRLEHALALAPPEAVALRAYLLSQVSRLAMLSEDVERAVATAREGIALAEPLGLRGVVARCLNNIGCARVIGEGDLRGLDDLERAEALASGVSAVEELEAMGNRASMLASVGRLDEALQLTLEADGRAREYGHMAILRWFEAEYVVFGVWRGEWEEARARADAFIEETGSSHYMTAVCHQQRALLRLASGEDAAALEDLQAALRIARRIRDPQVLHITLASAAFLNVELGRRDAAVELLDELLARWRGTRPASPSAILEAAWAARALGREAEVAAILAPLSVPSRWMVAAAHVAAGELREAAEVCATMPSLPDEAYARLRAAEQLVSEGRRAEADEQLGRALAFYRSVGASRYVREGEALLAATA